jgi:hypothetical protein
MKKSKEKILYPNLIKLGVEIHNEPYPHIYWDDLDAALKKNNLDKEKFSKYFGAQTMILINGKACPYPHDVEAVLERMKSGKLTGTQFLFD